MSDKSMSSVTVLLAAAVLVTVVTFVKTVVFSDFVIQYPEEESSFDPVPMSDQFLY